MANSDRSYDDIRYNAILDRVEFFNGSDWYAATESSDSAITSLTGGVTATGPGASAATVVSVGGSTAANIHAGEVLTSAATSTATASTLVKRDSSSQASLGGLLLTNAVNNSTVDARTTNAAGLSGLIARNDSDSTQAYFGIANSNYGDALLRNCPMIISAALSNPLVIETQGVIPPLYTTTNRDAISSPHEGLTIYNTSNHALEFYNGTSWKTVATV